MLDMSESRNFRTEYGFTGLTHADGLSVGRPSGFVGGMNIFT